MKNTLNEIKGKKSIIEVYGLGYIGFPLSVHLSSSGFKVTGIDTNPKKLERLKNNSLMESELSLKDEFQRSVNSGNFILSSSSSKSDNSKVGLICVSTPIPSKDTDSNIFVKDAVEKFLNTCKSGDVIIIESSIQVGTTEEIKQIIESCGYKVGEDFGLCYCPERIDPQNKKWNLKNIPRVIYCSDDISFEIAQNVYHYVNYSKLNRVESPRIAEVVKSFENTFRLVNISLVNELAILCEKLNISVYDVIEAASSKPFGFMPFYPGAGAGGHCIPKDPRFLLESARKFGAKFTSIEASLKINSYMSKHIVDSIEENLRKLNVGRKVLVCGLSYKPDIEDMRDSPGFKIINELYERNFMVSAYDPFYKKELREKYLQENNIQKIDFELINDLNDEGILKKFDCICIVQHHTKMIQKLQKIFEKSLVPYIYDCQHKISKI